MYGKKECGYLLLFGIGGERKKRKKNENQLSKAFQMRKKKAKENFFINIKFKN